jgi:signal transduction histidine kinase
MGNDTIRLCAFAFVAAICTGAAQAQVKSVVTVLGAEIRSPAYETMARAVRETLDASGDGAVEHYTEYLDNARFPGPEQEVELAEHLRKRYSDRHIDVVIAFDPPAVRFVLKHRDQIFPGVPVVFGAVRAPTLAQLKLPPDFIGLPVHLEPGPTIRMALALRPDARELVFVSGIAELDSAWAEIVRATPLPPGVRLRMLSGLPIDAIERELAALGPHTVVVTGTFRRDGAGRIFFGVIAVLERLARVSTAPIFHLYDNGVGHGAVGSFTVPVEAIGVQAATIAKQLLAGVPPVSVVLPSTAPVPIVDWRELRRWGMDEALLPAGTIVRFREPTFWQEYRYHVMAVAALILLETALVAGLLLQRRLRRRVEEQLRQNQRTMQLAANAAQLVMWNWDIERDDIWLSDGHHQVAGSVGPGYRTLQKFLSVIHPEDRDAVRHAVERAIAGDGNYESEYRVVGGDGVTRWYAGRGRVEHANNAPVQLRGVTLDITRRKSAEIDAQRQRNELAHLSRITVLGELSVSMAHELNQPLMAILSNAQAARMFIAHETVDLVELGAILDDIVENDKRAGEIIWGMRKMLKKEEAAHEAMPVNDMVQDVLRLMRGDLVQRGVAVQARLAADAPAIRGDRMQLQQVLINLIQNGCDAMAAFPRSERILDVRTESAGGSVRISVADRGGGIPAESMGGIFTPFFTTKEHGLGLGLSVCTSIIESHGGELIATNNDGRGATFTFVLGAQTEALA